MTIESSREGVSSQRLCYLLNDLSLLVPLGCLLVHLQPPDLWEAYFEQIDAMVTCQVLIYRKDSGLLTCTSAPDKSKCCFSIESKEVYMASYHIRSEAKLMAENNRRRSKNLLWLRHACSFRPSRAERSPSHAWAFSCPPTWSSEISPLLKRAVLAS